MSRMDKVVWSEGMFLTPQLFQQADRYHESLLHFALGAGQPFPWGLMALDIDAERLVNGDFSLVRASGLMPDGLAVRIPDHDPVPEGRSVKPLFSPSLDVVEAYLTVPAVRVQAPNIQLDRPATARNSSARSTRRRMATSARSPLPGQISKSSSQASHSTTPFGSRSPRCGARARRPTSSMRRTSRPP